MLGFLGVIVGIALLVFLAFKRVNVIVCTLICSIVVGLTNQMGFWKIFNDFYLPAAGKWITGYFLLFILSGMYARILSDTGAAAAIAYKIVDVFGKKRVILAMTILVIALTYGGVSGLVSIFLVWPIAVGLARETNKPKALFFNIFFFGFLTLAYTSLPGTPQLSNVLAAQMLGTSPTAAPVLSIVASVITFVLGYLYLLHLDKKYTKQGKVFEETGKGLNIPVITREECPNIFNAVIPMVVLIVLFILLSNGWLAGIGIAKMAAIPAINSSMIIAGILCVLLNWSKIKDLKATLGRGAQDGVMPAVSLFSMVAFSAVVSGTPTFASFIKWVINMPGHPYFQVVVASNAIGLVTASGNATVQITLNSFAKIWLASPLVNPAALTRIVSIASIGLSCGPHAGGLFANLEVSGVTMKEGYLPYFISCGCVSLIALFVTIGLALLGVV